MEIIYWSSFGFTSMYAEVSYYEIKIGTEEWSMKNNENPHSELQTCWVFLNLVSVFHTRSGIWQGIFYPLFENLNSYQDIIK